MSEIPRVSHILACSAAGRGNGAGKRRIARSPAMSVKSKITIYLGQDSETSGVCCPAWQKMTSIFLRVEKLFLAIWLDMNGCLPYTPRRAVRFVQS